MNAKDCKLISSSAMFAGLSQQECGRLLEFLRASENEYKAGELLHVPGAELKRFGFVLSGLVQVYRAGEGGRILMENRNIVLDRERLINEIWGYDYDGETNVV